MGRNKVIQQVYDRLARLENRREELIIKGEDTHSIDEELKGTREALAEIMNVLNESSTNECAVEDCCNFENGCQCDEQEECEHQDCDDHCCLDCGLENHEHMNMDPDVDMEK
jgi:hypothetical protein